MLNPALWAVFSLFFPIFSVILCEHIKVSWSSQESHWGEKPILLRVIMDTSRLQVFGELHMGPNIILSIASDEKVWDWSDQPGSTGSSRINWFNCRRLTAQPPGNRQQQQVVENQVSNWPTRYMVLGGFTPGTPVSTSFFLKEKRKELKRLKDKKKRLKRI